jgi:lipopolysaccharide biosynthesis protein
LDLLNDRAVNLQNDGLGQALECIGAGDETLIEPLRLKPFDHWVGHIPFAFWLVSALRPRTLVEMGTHRGNSFLAFCQAIEAERCGTRAYAVDTWEGDVHMAREEGLFEELSAYHDPRYGHFSSLVRATFDEARELFRDHSVDVLHIDGTHTYEAVGHDFATWESALSDRAVVLFHDTNVRRPHYGVWKLWEELAGTRPHFEFFHSFGLGVLGVGTDLPERLRALFAASSDEMMATRIRSFFAARGAVSTNRLAMEVQQERANDALRQHEAQLEGLRGQYEAQLQAQRTQHKAQLQALCEQQSRLLQAEAGLQRTLAKQEAARCLDHALREQQEKLLQADADLQRTQEKLEIADHLNQALRTSTSWRITGPLRSIGELMKRRRRPLPATPLEILPPERPVALEATSVALEPTSVTPEPTSVAPEPTSVAPIKMPDLFALRDFRPSARIAVVAHIFYPDLYEEVVVAIGHLGQPFDLFVTLVDGYSDHLLDSIQARFPEAQIWSFPNRGRDILPFMTIAATGALSGYALICKLHTKRSPHRSDGDAWRQHLVSGILPDRERTESLVSAFDADPDLGLVVADGEIFEGEEYWSGNVQHLENLLPLLGWTLEQVTKIRFAGGSIFWLRPLVLRDLVGLNLAPEAYEPEPTPIDGALVHAVERLFSVVCCSAGLRVEQVSALQKQPPEVPRAPAPRVVAFYLPQFHPIPENDHWWGRGFTEWTNVTNAKPLFSGHRQPRLPGELGFTDLRVPEVRAAQAELARAYGVAAFCYYYYWFGERGQLLRRPLDEVLASGEPDFPFMICWANEPWSRNWDGADREVLLAQDYTEGWAEAFGRDVAPILRDPRYVRLGGPGGQPMLMIYRIMRVPRPAHSMAALRSVLRGLNIGEVHLSAGCCSVTDDQPLPEDPRALNCDSFFEFPPHSLLAVPAPPTAMLSEVKGQVYEYAPTVDRALAQMVEAQEASRRHRAVMMGWDNTARRGRAAYVFRGATPGHFRRWLRGIVLHEQTNPYPEERLIFVNAWNEWAEGTCLEPDRDFGRGWLEAVRSALGRH